LAAIIARVLYREEASAGDTVPLGFYIDEYQHILDKNN